jgi:hypothetical protein
VVERKTDMKATTTLWHRTLELTPLILSLAMIVVGAAFTMGLVVPQQAASGIVLVVMGGLLSINNWTRLRARSRR